jgi:hypothetical protein
LPSTNLPELVSELIGRDAELVAVTDLAVAHRLITLVGAGGVGKTRLSFEVARRLLPQFADGVWVAELAPLSDPELVPVTVATALGVTLASPEAQFAGPRQVAHVIKQPRRGGTACRPVRARTGQQPRAVTPAGRVRVSGTAFAEELPAEGTQDEEDLLRAGFLIRHILA